MVLSGSLFVSNVTHFFATEWDERKKDETNCTVTRLMNCLRFSEINWCKRSFWPTTSTCPTASCAHFLKHFLLHDADARAWAKQCIAYVCAIKINSDFYAWMHASQSVSRSRLKCLDWRIWASMANAAATTLRPNGKLEMQWIFIIWMIMATPCVQKWQEWTIYWAGLQS